jgi:hypothetical protein
MEYVAYARCHTQSEPVDIIIISDLTANYLEYEANKESDTSI